MGIFDRFSKSKQTAPPPTSPSTAPPPLPLRATIESYEIADGVGMLAVEDGNRMRFGRSACKGFEPVVAASVILESVTSDSRGWRAKVVTLDPADTRYDGLMAARDAEMGLPSRRKSNDEAVATARQLSAITLLLKEPLPEATIELAAWAKARGFPRGEVDVMVERDLSFTIAGAPLLTYPGRCPMPRDGLDARNLPTHFDYGRSFLGFGAGLVGFDRKARVAMQGGPDCWAEDGKMRRLSRLVRDLASDATGVVLHRAGELVVPIEVFVGMLGDLEDPDCRPFAAFIDVGITERDGQKRYATFGMDVFGLPDVVVPVNANDRFSRSRRHEAVLYACYRMIRENRELTSVETLDVPLRTNIGAWPIMQENKEAVSSYAVGEEGSLLSLTPTKEVDPAAEWRDRGATIAVNAYQALLDRGLADAIPSDLARDIGAAGPSVIPHAVEVRARRDGRGFMVVTNGFGRMPQQVVERADCTHIELAAWVPEDSIDLVRLVGGLAGQIHSATGSWKPADTIRASIEELGIGGFVLADGGAVDMGGGPSVRLMLLVPLAPEEYERVCGGHAAEWLAKNPIDARRWEPFLAHA